jgi:hypothetical protein
MPYRPRDGREFERIRLAAASDRRETGSALDAALAEIGTAFDHAAGVNEFKIRVERWLRLGPQHGAARARFGARAAMLSGRSLGTAVVVTERWWRDECRAFQLASALGYGNRHSLDVLRELRLILRLMRAKQMDGVHDEIIATLRDTQMPLAAE